MNGDPALALLVSAKKLPSGEELAGMAGDPDAASSWVRREFSRFDEAKATQMGARLAAVLAQLAPVTARENAGRG